MKAISHYKFFLFFLLLAGGFISARSVSAKILLPNGAGDHTDWTGTYEDVNEYPANDGDASYNAVSTENASQSYNFADNSDSGTVDGVRLTVYAKAAAGTAEHLRLFLRAGSPASDYSATSDCVTLNTTDYTRCSYYWDKDPSDNLAWTTPDLTALQAGFKTIANGTWDGAEHRVSQVYLDVDFKTETKKIKYHLVQRILPVNPTSDDGFTFSIADPVDEVRSAFIEIKGIAIDVNPLNVGVAVNNDPATPGAYDATYAVNAGGRPTYFKIIHDVTDNFKSFVTSSGEYTRYIHLSTNANVYLLNAKLTIVYSYIIAPQVTGAYNIEGKLISATFDSGASEGAAYNSIMWKGTLGGPGQNQGKVRFQLATSNCSNGANDYPACSGPPDQWGDDFIGSDDVNCGSAYWFEPQSSLPDTPAEIKCYSALNNKRYFRYKIQICSDNCSSGGNYTPTVNDVVVSWSP